MSAYGEITRDGFRCSYGRFFAQGVERIEGSRLKAMFLPRLAPEAKQLLRNHSSFVRGQLQHYGADYDAREFSGNGVLLLKKVLQAGKASSSTHATYLLRHRYANVLTG